MENMMAYCASSRFEDSAEASTSFLSSTFNANFDFSASTAAYELYSNEGDDAINNDEAILANKELLKELENNREKIKRLENDLAYHRQHIDTIEEEHNELTKSLTEYEIKIREKDEKLETLEKTVYSLKCELESFYNTDTSANATSSSSELHGTLSYSSDSANNLRQSSCSVETKIGKPKKDHDEPECKVLKEFISEYNELLEENFKLKEKVKMLSKESADLKDIISYHDQTSSKNSNDISNPFASTPGLTLADELSIENQEMPSVIMGIENQDLSYLDQIIHDNAKEPSDEQNNENEKLSLDMTSIEHQEMPSVIMDIGNQDLSYIDQIIHENAKEPSDEQNNENEKVPLVLMYFVFFLIIALIWKGFILFDPARKLKSELKPYYTAQEIISDFFNQLALYF